jgi:uncharacterized membrane protein YfcA
MPLEFALTVLILFGATLTASTFGFGGALFSMPLLTLVLGLEVATPLYGLVGWTTALIVMGTSWREASLQLVWRLILATLVGIPLGVLLVRTMPSEILVKGLGAFLMAFGLYRLLALPMPTLKRPNWAYGFGLVAGVLGGAYNTGGPPLVVYATMNRWPPVTFRATLQSCFLVTGLGVLISHGLGGLWTAQVWQLFALSMPIVVPTVWLGAWLNRHMPVQQFERILFVILIILGIMLLV